MKPIDFKKLLVPINVALTGLVFLLLDPTTRIYARWFPDKEDTLWVYPLSVVLISSLLWLLTSLNLPFLIEKGVFQDRRKDKRPPSSNRTRVIKSILPVLTFIFHMLLIVGICYVMVQDMREGSTGNFLDQIASKADIRN